MAQKKRVASWRDAKAAVKKKKPKPMKTFPARPALKDLIVTKNGGRT